MGRNRAVSIAVFTGLVVILGSALPANAALPLKRKACGALVRESFRLKNDMNCRGDALRIRADGITIDLNGKVIEGDGGDDDNGIENEGGFSDLTILSRPGQRRAVIRKFDHGVKTFNANAVTIRRLVIKRTLSHGIDLEGGSGHQVLNNRVSTAGKNGILLIGDDGLVRSNRATNNTFHGIYVDGDTNLVESNRGNANDYSGINITGDDNDVDQNFTFGNGLNGIGIAGDINDITSNDVRNNQITGIHISGDQNEVQANYVCGTASTNHINDSGTGTTLNGNTTADAC